MAVKIHKIAAGFLLIVLFTGCAGLGGKPTPTPEPEIETFKPMVSVTGVVVPAQWAALSLTTGGVVDELLVSEGTTVQAGQTLLRLKGETTLKATVTSAELALLSARQDLNKLNENHKQALAAAQVRLAQARKALDKAQDRRESKEFRVGSQAQIDAARADLVLAEDAVKKAEETFTGVADRAEDDVIRAAALSALSAARQQRDRAKANLNYLLSLPNQIEVNEAQANLEAAQVELDEAQKEYDKLKNGPDPDDVELLQARITNAQAQLEAARNALAELELDAPFGGEISKLNIRAKEWIAPGQPVLLLADLQNLRVETTDLSEIDVARIQVGSRATITFDALPEVSVQGEVLTISPKSAEGAGVNYTAILRLASIPGRLRWGMTAFVDIETGDS